MTYSIVMNPRKIYKLIEAMHRMQDRPDIYSLEDKYQLVRQIVGLMQVSGHIKTEGFGMDKLPAEGGYILYPNHQGKYDAYSIVSVHDKPLAPVMDREMSYFPFVSEIVDVLGGKRMDIHDVRHGLRIMNEVAKEAAEGSRYIIFPEGGYDDSKHNTLWDFKAGCFKAAARAGVPIVPVALLDSYKPYNSRAVLPVKTQVHFLEPIMPEEYKSLNTYRIADLVKERISNKLKELGCKKS